MVLEVPRRRFVRSVNSKYIYGRVVSEFLPIHKKKEFEARFAILSRCLVALSGLNRLADSLHSSRQPLVHTIIFLIELAMVGRLIAKFNSYYAERPGTFPRHIKGKNHIQDIF